MTTPHSVLHTNTVPIRVTDRQLADLDELVDTYNASPHAYKPMNRSDVLRWLIAQEKERLRLAQESS